MNNLNELKKLVLADGVIDEQEVKQLREVLYEDGVIDKEEAEFLFELNDAVSGKPNHPSWGDFFVEAITDFLLSDEISPGEVDEDESIWLIEKIQKDGQVDELELDLVKNLQKKAIKLHKSLVDFINSL